MEQPLWSSDVHRWWLSDVKSERIEPFFFRALNVIENVRVEGKGKCLIHCYQGVSRSVTLIIAYLMWLENMTYQDALDCVRKTRGIARPNIGFQCQVTLWRSMYMDVTKGTEICCSLPLFFLCDIICTAFLFDRPLTQVTLFFSFF